jgi:P-type Cu2+ transporter
MRAAQTQRPAALRLADRLAGPFLWGVLVLAALAALVWSFVDPARAVWVAVSVLIVTCPCAVSLAAPSALLAATGALARRGVLLQRLEALEALAKVDTLFVDKTGTLTEDRLALRAVHVRAAAPDVSEGRLLQQAASLAALSSHPMAQALVAASGVESQRTELIDPAWSDVHEQPGSGLQACGIDGASYRLGSHAWVSDCVGPAHEAHTAASQVWFGPVGSPWVAFELEEALRPDAAAALQRLRDDGVRVVLLSGDQVPRVDAMAQRLHLRDAVGAATPEAKLAAVAAAQAQGHVVAMAGDGLNDAPVLARADVSFAFAQGSALTQANADAVVLGNRLADVAFAFTLARRCVRVVRQNLLWAVLYNAASIPLALLGALPPWAAGLGMALSSLFVVLNSTRLARR